MQDNIISLLDENGVESQFEVILTLEAENKEYAILMPVDDEEAEEAPCSYKQTSFCASMIGSLITNLYVNFCANRCNPLIERSLPFITEYNAETMFLKVES